MEKKEILAEFMGFVNGGDFWASSGKKPFITEINGHRFYPADLMFDTSRDWFHPVWEKFRDLKIENNKGVFPNTDVHKAYCNVVSKLISYGTLPEAFEELVKGVIWYNSIKDKRFISGGGVIDFPYDSKGNTSQKIIKENIIIHP